jgi:tetratricopeptide (TPR) repeat protein
MAPDKIERLCLKAREAIGQRDWEKAKQVYLMALGLRSDLPDVHYGLATVYFQLRELTSAAHHFKEVTRLDPLRAGAYVNLGAVHNLLSQFDDAIAALRRGIQLDPQRVEGYYNLGLVYRRKGQTDLAIQAYREAIRINPRMADAHLNLANLYLDKQQHRQALQFYDQALQVRPGWDKALEGREHVHGLMSGEIAPPAPPPTPGRGPAKAAPPTGDLDRVADPTLHGGLLTALHQSTIISEEVGRQFQRILLEEVEPAIKELSSCLLYPEGPRSELDECVQKFELALQHLQSTQVNFKSNLARLRQLGRTYPET